MSSNVFVVRGPNWNVDISLDFNDKFSYIEAASRALESLFKKIESDDSNLDNKPSIGQYLQVALKEYDISLDSNKILFSKYLDMGYIQFLDSVLILANIGKHAQSNFLKTLIEEKTNKS